MSKFKNWKDVEKELNFTPEEEAEIKLEMELIEATIKAREKANLTQRELSAKTGLTQSVIARLESNKHAPNVSTLIKILTPLGYGLRVVPLEQNKIKTKK